MANRPTKNIDQLGLPPGFTLERTSSGGHLTVITPEGDKLRLPSGMPCQVSVSPGDFRSRRHEAAKIRQALRAREEEV